MPPGCSWWPTDNTDAKASAHISAALEEVEEEVEEALGSRSTYTSSTPDVFHLAQIQGFLACFAVGFLMTMIPRRTGTAPPTSLELALCALALAGTVAGAWFGVPGAVFALLRRSVHRDRRG